MDKKKYLITIQSYNRKEKIGNNLELFPDCHYFVPSIDKEYSIENIHFVEGDLPCKHKQLNAALDYGFSNGYEYVVTLDDDFLQCLEIYLNENEKKKGCSIHPIYAIENTIEELSKHKDIFLAGYSNSFNPFYSDMKIKEYGFLMGGCLIHKSQNLVRFDENLSAIEDLDYVLMHHVVYGKVIRDNRFLFNFEIEGKSKNLNGGYQGLRKISNYNESLLYMIKKYKNNPFITLEQLPIGESIYKKVKWKKIKIGENQNLESLDEI